MTESQDPMIKAFQEVADAAKEFHDTAMIEFIKAFDGFMCVDLGSQPNYTAYHLVIIDDPCDNTVDSTAKVVE